MTAAVAGALLAVALAAGRRLPPGGVKAWLTDSCADTCVFSYRRDFSALWGLDVEDDEGGLGTVVEALAGRELMLVVVWDGQPEDASVDAVSVGQYVTPYEWAAALSLALYRRYAEAGADEQPRIRMLIVDITSSRMGAGFIQRSLFAFHNTFPWLQDYRPGAIEAEAPVEYVIDDKDKSQGRRPA